MDVPSEVADGMLRRGFASVVTQQEVDQFRQARYAEMVQEAENKAYDNPLIAAGLGAARTAIPGADLLLRGTGLLSQKSIDKYGEVNPGWTSAGEVGGVLLPGGITNRVGSAVLGRVGSGLAGKVASSVAESTAIAGTSALSQYAKTGTVDPVETAKEALLTGGLSAATSLVGAGLIGAARKTKRVITDARTARLAKVQAERDRVLSAEMAVQKRIEHAEDNIDSYGKAIKDIERDEQFFSSVALPGQKPDMYMEGPISGIARGELAGTKEMLQQEIKANIKAIASNSRKRIEESKAIMSLQQGKSFEEGLMGNAADAALAMMLGPKGFIARMFLGAGRAAMSAERGAVGGKVADKLSSAAGWTWAMGAKIVPPAMKSSRRATVQLLSDDDVENVRDQVSVLDPAAVHQAAYEGYGPDSPDAAKFAIMQGERVSILKEALPAPGQSKVSFSKTYAAVSDPVSMFTRVGRGEPTREDMLVMRRMLPDEYKRVQSLAQMELDVNGKKMPPSRKRLLAMLIDPDGYLLQVQKTASIIAQVSVQSPPQQNPPAQNMPKIQPPLTATQRLQAMGGIGRPVENA